MFRKQNLLKSTYVYSAYQKISPLYLIFHQLNKSYFYLFKDSYIIKQLPLQLLSSLAPNTYAKPMKLYTHCSGCGEEITIKSPSTDRGKVQMSHDTIIKVSCQHCGRLEKIQLHKVHAEVNSFHLFIAFAASALLSVVIWLAFEIISPIFIIIPVVFWLQQLNAARNFNKHRIRRP